jgi:class 3 adenylate cyclase
MDTHDDLVRRRLNEYRGRLIRTTGDGMLATFDGPARAVRSAFAIRDGLLGVGLEIRSGLHTGEVEIRKDEIGGIGVHIGARIMSVAQPREILVSSTVKELVVGSGIKFEDRGEHELRGVPESWRLFAAVE